MSIDFSNGNKCGASPELNNVFIGGIAVCNAGNLATCGHEAAGLSNVFAGG